MIEVVLPAIFAHRPDVRGILEGACAGLKAADRDAKIVSHETGTADIVVLWGAGHPAMLDVMNETVARGAHVIAWDAGYWERATHLRCSIDAVHPTATVMAKARSPDRFDRLGIALRNEWNREGPIVLVGMGVKCAAMYGEPIGRWEHDMAVAVASRFPGRTILFRPRPGAGGHCRDVPGCTTVDKRPIETVLKGASLVVCRHSNVAVDAIVAGIPVVSEGGAAAAVCPMTLDDVGEPLADDVRLQFLYNLAWLNWSRDELRLATTWQAIEEVMT